MISKVEDHEGNGGETCMRQSGREFHLIKVIFDACNAFGLLKSNIYDGDREKEREGEISNMDNSIANTRISNFPKMFHMKIKLSS